MGKINLILFVLLAPLICYSIIPGGIPTEVSEEQIMNTNCQWVLVALEHKQLQLAKDKYYSTCNEPSYKSPDGYSFLAYTVDWGYEDQVEWVLTLSTDNVNDSIYGETLLYRTVYRMIKDNIYGIDQPRYIILKLLLQNGADPLLPNSNKETTYFLLKSTGTLNSTYGTLVQSYISQRL